MLQRYLPPFDSLFSPRGRLNRLQYFGGTLLFALIAGPILYMIMYRGDTGAIANIILAAIALPIAYLCFCLHAKRLHDLGLPAIISLALLVGGLVFVLTRLLGSPDWLGDIGTVAREISHDASIGLGFYLLLAPGQFGDNRYGSDPISREPE